MTPAPGPTTMLEVTRPDVLPSPSGIAIGNESPDVYAASYSPSTTHSLPSPAYEPPRAAHGRAPICSHPLGRQHAPVGRHVMVGVQGVVPCESDSRNGPALATEYPWTRMK